MELCNQIFASTHPMGGVLARLVVVARARFVVISSTIEFIEANFYALAACKNFVDYLIYQRFFNAGSVRNNTRVNSSRPERTF